MSDIPKGLITTLQDLMKEKRLAAMHTQSAKALQDSVLEMFKAGDIKTVPFKDDHNENHKATMVESAPSVFLDEDMLRKQVGAATWNKITSRVLDQTKLQALIQDGTISARTVAKCSSERERAPYIRIT
jgi:hypothetical protein